MLRRLLVIASALFAGFYCVQPAAFCAAHPSVAEEFKAEPLVFVATIVSQKDITDAAGFIAGTFYTVRVTEILKGSPAQNTKLYSENSSGRFPMEIGVSYLVFAGEQTFEGLTTPQLAVNACGNSGSLQEADKALRTARKLGGKQAQQGAPADARSAELGRWASKKSVQQLSNLN